MRGPLAAGSAPPGDPLSCQRREFSLPDGVHYLNCAYMSPLPKCVEEAGQAGLHRKRDPSRIGPADFFEDGERARALFARLIGVPDPARVAIIPAVSYGVATAARNLPCARNQNIVVSGEQFPSHVHAWRRLAAREGLEVRTIQAPASERRAQAWNEALLAAIDAGTAIVALPHVHWTDGTRFDLERIGERAKAHGAAFIIDGTQSVGACPFEAARVHADAVICAAYKWLLGPYSIGLAWLGPRFDDGEPLEETWIARAGSEDFRSLVHYRDGYQAGAARYDVGERSNFILVPMLVRALELVLHWGPARIEDYCRRLSSETLDQAGDLGFGVEDPHWRGAHLFGLRAPEGVELRALQAALEDRGVSVSLRGSAMRVSPHVYNDAADMAALGEVLRASRITA